jgi:general nucleoside transport system permease protein
MDVRIIVGLFALTLVKATPLTLGALSGIFCERSGVVNIAIEGMMLTAAFSGFAAAFYSGSSTVGILVALLTGALLGLLHATLSIRFELNQIISGTVINLMAVGVTGYFNRVLFASKTVPGVRTLPMIEIPLLSKIPYLGTVLFKHQPIVFATMLLVALSHVVIYHTPWGLRTRAIGEHPRAADTLGVNVNRMRYINVMVGGAVAGLAGAFLSLEAVGTFEKLMSNGRGFIALAAMLFGKYTPFGAWGAALLFGFSEALGVRLQIENVNIPYQFLGMLPYLLTIIVLAGVVGKATAPAASGKPYKSE